MRVVIIGAGVTGLAVAWKLSKDHEVVLLERNSSIGGIAGSFQHQGFTLDLGPHKIYSLIPGILDEMRALLGTEAIAIPKTSGVIVAGKRLDYPIKFFDLLLKLKPLTSLKLGIGYGAALGLSFFRRKRIVSYADYFRANFGMPAYDLVFKPLAMKSWGDPESLTAELARKRSPYSGVFKMVKSMLFKDRKLSAENFYYPKHGFIGMSKIMLNHVLSSGSNILFNADVKKFGTKDGRIASVEFKHGGHMKKIDADYVVSSVPVTALPSMFNAPPEIMTAASELKFRSLLLVYVLVNRSQVMQDVWTFVPDKSFIFQRISEQKNFSKELGPENQTVLVAEVMCAYNDSLWNASDEELYRMVIPDLISAGFVKSGEAAGFYVARLKNIYPVYELGYRERLDAVLNFTDQFENFITIGRLGLFNYNNTDHCIDMAIWAAQHIRERKPVKDWIQTRKRFDDYVIVD
ncbi:FAD-dependent oxidoreductase [Candidatus Woesearchaeota archaeon]|nr:FAD-dependent oxidoreductase [Candidatus Woesearchaeota archaeon]